MLLQQAFHKYMLGFEERVKNGEFEKRAKKAPKPERQKKDPAGPPKRVKKLTEQAPPASSASSKKVKLSMAPGGASLEAKPCTLISLDLKEAQEMEREAGLVEIKMEEKKADVVEEAD